MGISSVSASAAVNSNVNGNDPLPNIPTDKVPTGHDPVQDAFFLALQNLENALNAAKDNPSDQDAIQNLEKAETLFSQAETALKGGNAEDQTVAKNFDKYLSNSPLLQAVLTAAASGDDKATETAMYNLCGGFFGSVNWGNAIEQLTSFDAHAFDQ